MGYRKTWLRSYNNRLLHCDESTIKLIKRIELIGEEKEGLKALMALTADTFEEILCKKYIEYGRLKDVVSWLSNNNYRFESSQGKSRLYTVNDISNIIQGQSKNRDNNFGCEALKLFKLNKQFVFD